MTTHVLLIHRSTCMTWHEIPESDSDAEELKVEKRSKWLTARTVTFRRIEPGIYAEAGMTVSDRDRSGARLAYSRGVPGAPS